ncbi:hypothetical protein AURDEDRAFT_131135 [Auricularia subglabra TFB-10046 SS5]|uniref:Uncharacterized protein n=1 Tax=Auricularia subglabra (strain TFB-10046 / SS5) TaxID=717982 RepID=J0WRD9_AURST|nr:hypothetical protein AURDEDRAFT_131135 [Auricularia subglabra TFB-10046 SS5]
MSTMDLASALAVIRWHVYDPAGLFYADAKQWSALDKEAVDHALRRSHLERSARDSVPEYVHARLVHARLAQDLYDTILRISDYSAQLAELSDADPDSDFRGTELCGDLALQKNRLPTMVFSFKSAALHLRHYQPPTPVPAIPLAALPVYTDLPTLVDGEFPGFGFVSQARKRPREDDDDNALSVPARKKARDESFLTNMSLVRFEETNSLIRKRADESANRIRTLTITGKEISGMAATIKQLIRQQAGLSAFTLNKPATAAKFIPEMAALASRAAATARQEVSIDTTRYATRLLSHATILSDIESEKVSMDVAMDID